MRKERPIISGDDAKRFMLNKKLKESRLKLRLLQQKAHPINTQIYLTECEIFEIEEDLKELSKPKEDKDADTNA